MNHIAPAAGSAALLAWAWNTAFPGMAMGAEVAVAAVVVLAPVFAYFTAFLPRPKRDDGEPLGEPQITHGMSEGGVG